MSNTKIENILDFSNEVLAMIFAYVPNHQNLSLVCTKFRKVSCNFKFCDLSIRHDDRRRDGRWELLDDEDLFKSLIKSNRRIKSLGIYACYLNLLERVESSRLTQIVDHIGCDIKSLNVKDIELPHNIIDILSLMPKLERISIWGCIVTFPGAAIDKDNKLSQLLKLKELRIDNCDHNTINIFKRLPDVLQKVELRNLGIKDFSSIKLFESQHNIKELITNEKSVDFINFNQLKLTSLELYGISREANLEKILKGQSELNSLQLWNIFKNSLKFIGNELKSLKSLTGFFDVTVQSDEFTAMSKLKMLSQLTLTFSNDYSDLTLNECLSFMAISNLEQLNIRCRSLCLTEPTVKQLGVNLPKLKKLALYTGSSINLFNSIIQHMSDLEDLEFHQYGRNNDRYISQDNLKNDKIKTVVILAYVGVNMNFEELPRLIGCLKNLNSLSIISNWNISVSFVKSLKENIGAIQDFKCVCSVPEAIRKSGLIETEFSQIFSVIKCIPLPRASHWIMQK